MSTKPENPKEQLVPIDCVATIPVGSELESFLERHPDAAINLIVDKDTGTARFEVVNYEMDADYMKVLSKTKFDLSGARLRVVASKFKSGQAEVAAKGNAAPRKNTSKGKGSR